jgi:hypothetical protein
MKKRQKGMGILQISLGLFVATVAAAGALQLYSALTISSKANTTISEVETVSNLIIKLYSNQANFAGLTEAQVRDSGALPASMISGSKITHASGMWGGGGQVIIRSMSRKCPTCSATFWVRFAEVQPEVCPRLLAHGFPPNFWQVMVSGSPDSQFVQTMPLTAAQARSACGSRTTPDVTFYVDPSEG